jgi:paraquat-inducible protein B
MAARANYVKIGLFVMLGAGAVVAIAIVIGVSKLHRETVPYYTYFNEAVTGLEVGAPVKARGVTIGQVGSITFAPDHITVEVRSDLDVDALVRLGLRSAEERHSTRPIPPDIRAQLATQGLTGMRFIALDVFDPKTNPPPELSFHVPQNYIPAARSIQKTLEESVVKAMDGLADLIDTLAREQLAEKVIGVTERTDEVLRTLHQVLKSVDQQRIPQRTAATVNELRAAANKINGMLDHLNGDAGLLASTQRSISSFGEAGRNASETTRNLDSTLEEIRAAAAAIRLLADRLERDPDMLLKGRAKGKAP